MLRMVSIWYKIPYSTVTVTAAGRIRMFDILLNFLIVFSYYKYSHKFLNRGGNFIF